MTTFESYRGSAPGSPAIRSAAALGRVIRREREARGLTQTDLAQAGGATRQAVLKLEAGHETQALRTVFDLLSAMGIELTIREVGRHGS